MCTSAVPLDPCMGHSACKADFFTHLGDIQYNPCTKATSVMDIDERNLQNFQSFPNLIFERQCSLSLSLSISIYLYIYLFLSLFLSHPNISLSHPFLSPSVLTSYNFSFTSTPPLSHFPPTLTLCPSFPFVSSILLSILLPHSSLYHNPPQGSILV